MWLESFINNSFIQIVFVLGVAFAVQHFGGTLVVHAFHKLMRRHNRENALDRKKRIDTLGGIFRTSFSLVVWLVAAGFILAILRIDIAQVATGAGFLGIIIGLGAQATIRDYLAGMFILGENQYRVGDIVTLNGAGVSQPTSGMVEDITLRITKLRDLDGTVHIVRNGEASIITNRTFEYSSVVIDVGVSYDSDIDEVEKVVNRVGKDMLKDQELAKIIKEPIHFLRVDNFADSSIMIRLLGKVTPAKQWEVAGEYRRRMLKSFRENGIEIAFPQVVVHNAKNKA